MGKRPADIDAYIAAAPAYARPILEKVRTLFHKACPGVTEAIKWGHPAFEHEGPLGGMAAFKAHVVVGFWKQKLLPPEPRIPDRLASAADLPPDRVLLSLIRAAAKLNEEGVKVPRTARRRPDLPVPKDLAAALRKDAKARAAFDAFPPSHRREYIEWITESKRDETRQRRIATTLEWLAEGKPRNWKYMK